MNGEKFLILDGGFGTMLLARGLPAGESPERWNQENPEAVAAVHRDYAAAGSRVVYANTFGAAARCLHGEDIEDLVAAGVRAARAGAGEGVRVAVDLGPLGALLAPLGSVGFEEAYAAFRAVAAAGERAGADLAVAETMSDLLELKAALLAVKENTRLPVWATMTFERGGRSFTGCSVTAFTLTADALGAQALGFNCSLGPAELLPLAREAAAWTDKPLILKPNAGLPDPVTGRYPLAPAEFAAAMRLAAAQGVTVLGGCCGTTPDYIAALAAALRDAPEPKRPARAHRGLCSDRAVLHLCPGETVQASAGEEPPDWTDSDEVQDWPVELEDDGAELIFIDVGGTDGNLDKILPEVVTAAQSAASTPLLLRCGNASALAAALRRVRGHCAAVLTDPSLRAVCKANGAAVVLPGELPGALGFVEADSARFSIFDA